ncbi:MAG: 67 kDa myosin-cross-reactive antigen family protein [Parcubacteria group bacterium GW2011_GWF2_38_76]|nr:MAG: 67 kDa myosin-cross-reactive antigen family protein [Parcubacteria group bacterium GW2011_GWF2_38_76]HBM45961.1 oleate hydratase [Patescibacteria group bacterium]
METENKKAYLIGGGIASLSAAVYLIRDGGFSGKNIYILESSEDLGGSLDGKGSPKDGYVCRGGRMFSEEVYSCTFDLLSSIPLHKSSKKTLRDDFVKFNKEVRVNAKARLVENRKIIDSSFLGLSDIDRIGLANLISLPESFFDSESSKISDYFSPSFFETNFWFEWCTTFAFQPWHSIIEFKRYLLRFIQEFPRINTMTGVKHTRYTQFDSIVTPVADWLKNEGVIFLMNHHVLDLEFTENRDREKVKKIIYSKEQHKEEIIVEDSDIVLFTNGSMTSNSSLGNNKSAPETNTKKANDSWRLWEKIAKGRPHFGKPHIFEADIDKMKWESFTVTLKDKKFIELIKKFSDNEPGTGGIVTFKDSNWLLSIAIPNQPHFANQPEDIFVWGGYGLSPDKEGNFIKKKMSECTGEELVMEVCCLLGFDNELSEILEHSDCVPCMMPYITSQFMPRNKGDRPLVIPEKTENFTFLGQYCEIQDEVVFTVEQSVRSAMIAVYGLLGINKEIPTIYKGVYDPEVIMNFMKTVFNKEGLFK